MSSLPEGWVETELSSVVSHLGDGLHGTPKYSDDGEYYFINGNNLREGKIVFTKDTKRASIDEFNKHKKNLNNRTLFVSINGTLGNIAEYNNERCFLGKSACYFNILDDVDKKFIKYVLTNHHFQKYIDRLAGGTTIKNVSLKTMREYPVNLPPLPEQKSIANILSSFDEKIELLREQNETLETLAQTIFKEWFVNFNYPDATGEMVDSEFGEIPKGWRVGQLSEIAIFLNGLALQKYPPQAEKETLPVIKIRELKQGITSQTDRANTTLDKKYIIENGDILFSWSGSLEVVIWKYGKGALNQHLFKISSYTYPKWFYYYWTLYHLREFRGIAASKATTMGHIQRKHLDDAMVLIPDDKLIEDGTKLFHPLLEKIILTNEQIQTLTKTRDTLLPKLMSGEIRVNSEQLKVKNEIHP